MSDIGVMNTNDNKSKHQLVFVEETWITGDTCVYNIKDMMARSRAKAALYYSQSKI